MNYRTIKQTKSSKNIIRVLAAAVLMLALLSGVTFAALQSQRDTLSGNTIQTANASLQLSLDGAAYSDSHVGYDFTNLIPGGQPMPVAGYSVYLKNTGSSSLALKMAVSSTPSNPSGVDLSKVSVLLTPVGTGTGAQSFSLQSLIDGFASGGPAITGASLSGSAVQQYKLQVAMSTDAVSGSSASLGNIDLVFSGSAVGN